MMYSAAKVQGGKKFTAVHPLAVEAREARSLLTQYESFVTQSETGKKANPLASLPGSRRPPPVVQTKVTVRGP